MKASASGSVHCRKSTYFPARAPCVACALPGSEYADGSRWCASIVNDLGGPVLRKVGPNPAKHAFNLLQTSLVQFPSDSFFSSLLEPDSVTLSTKELKVVIIAP